MTQQTVDAPAAATGPALPDAEPAVMTTATRYLCVGAYLDPVFRDRSLREVYYQSRRYVAPSYGFDLVTVLHHCLRARNLAIWRDGSIVAVLAAAAYLNWLAVAVVGAALVCLRVTGAAWTLVRDFLARVRRGTAVDTTKDPRRGLLLLLGWAAAWIVLIVLVSRVVAATAGSVAGTRGIGSRGAVLLAVAVFALPGVFALWRQKRIEDFAGDGPPPPAPRTRRMAEIDQQQHGNTIVYSNFEPFIGSGDVVGSWGFAIRLVRKEPDAPGGATRAEGRREFPEPPFTAEEIVDYVRNHLRALTTEASAELRIPELTVEDRIYRSAREFGARALHTDDAEMAEIIRNPTNPARHYLACQVVSWGGDIVTTVHVHIAIQGRSLYLEVTSTTMAPCNEGYRIVDMEGGTGPRAWARALGTAIRETPRTIVHAPANLARALADIVGQGGGGRRPGISRRRRDRGALVSVRQLGTRDKLRNFTQRQDILKFRRLIENRVYAHVLDFLDEHEVDTTEYRARSASVFNVGVGVFGNNNETVVHGNSTGQQNNEQPAQ